MTSHRSSTSRSAQMLGDNLVITGGHFKQLNDHSVTNIAAATKGGFERLQEAAASTAFHYSAQMVDPPKCHPNTRIAVMKKIMDWISGRDDRVAWIMWLYGAAGAGKSAIARSIAELCIKHGIPIASFFFFRTDPTRNNIRPLVATLAYQLVRTIPASRNIIIQAIDNDPLVFEQSFEYQLETLILHPLREIGPLPSSNPSSHPSPLLILVDGLDECDNHNAQSDLLRTFSNTLANTKSNAPFLILIVSRPEAQITMAFNSRKCASILSRLALDERYLPEDDIRLFLNDKFADIRETHPRSHLLDPAWPGPHIVDDLVEKSSRQFIYAAVAMNYISSPRGHPAHRLEEWHGLRPVRSDTPFAQLDTLYRHIFSQVQNMDITQPVLAMALYGGSSHFKRDNIFLAQEETENLINALFDLSSVISVDPIHGGISFLHASLPDFLGDQGRSGEYYMDVGIWSDYLAVLWFQLPKRGWPEYQVLFRLLKQAAPTPKLQSELVEIMPDLFHYDMSRYRGMHFLIIFDLVSAVESMDFNDGGKTYHRFFSRFAPYIETRFPGIYPTILQKHSPASPTVIARPKSIFSEVSSS